MARIGWTLAVAFLATTATAFAQDAIFSDQDKRVYEAIPSTKPVVVPVKTN